MRLSRRLALAAAGGVLLCGALLHAAHRPPLFATRGMVAAPHPLASAAGIDILRKGGNAVDAAVAVALAVAVVQPQSAGIGGGGFALWLNRADRTVRALDFRERAPLAATRDMYLDAHGQAQPAMSTEGHLSVAVPGTVAGLVELHVSGGRLPWKDVVAPSVKLAEEGFLVGPRLREALVDAAPLLRRFPDARVTFLKRDIAYETGDLLIQRDLADTLRAIEQDGAAGFYGGDVARAIASEMEEHGGLVTLEDLAAYQPVWRQPLSGPYRDHTVVSFPPPSSGGVHLLQMLAFLQPHDVKALGFGSSAYLHLLAEAMRRAYADRAKWLGDPAFVDVPIEGLLAPAYLRARWADFTFALATPNVVAGDPWAHHSGRPAPRALPAPRPRAESPDTSHLCVVDSEGNAVSLTFTINTPMGSGVVVPGTGILLNNEMDDFSSAPGQPNAYELVGGEANAIGPAKIPLSSMTPTLVFDGVAPVLGADQAPGLIMDPSHRLRLVLGAPGGSTIITTVMQILVAVIDFGRDVQQAVDAPRVHHQWRPEVLRAEDGALVPEVVRGLFARGHTVRSGGRWGNAMAVEVTQDGLAGAADPRGEGAPAGY